MPTMVILETIVIKQDPSAYVPSQWEMALQCDAISHWLGAYTEWSLIKWNSTVQYVSRIMHIVYFLFVPISLDIAHWLMALGKYNYQLGMWIWSQFPLIFYISRLKKCIILVVRQVQNFGYVEPWVTSLVLGQSYMHGNHMRRTLNIGIYEWLSARLQYLQF